MTTKRGRARVFDDAELHQLLNDVTEAQAQKQNAQPAEVMRVAFMCAFYLGLRVQEIAGLEWNIHVFNSDGEFRNVPTPLYHVNGDPVIGRDGKPEMEDMQVIWISGDIGKYGKERTLPVPKELSLALRQLHALNLSDTFVVPSAKSGAANDVKHRAHALKMRINRMYKALGLERGSTHSGRRSFITRAARRAETVGNSLLDVRDLAGHSSIQTTQKYVDPSKRQRDLVEAVWS